MSKKRSDVFISIISVILLITGFIIDFIWSGKYLGLPRAGALLVFFGVLLSYYHLKKALPSQESLSAGSKVTKALVQNEEYLKEQLRQKIQNLEIVLVSVGTLIWAFGDIYWVI